MDGWQVFTLSGARQEHKRHAGPKNCCCCSKRCRGCWHSYPGRVCGGLDWLWHVISRGWQTAKDLQHTQTDVETQVSTGAYRPYSKTLYWTCWSAATFAFFAFSHISRTSHFSHFRALRVFTYITFSHLAQFAFQIPRVFAHLTNYAHLAFPHSSQFTHSRISRVSHFRAFCVFRILAFFTLRHALPRASLGSIAFHSHVLSSSSKVHWCVSHFVSLAFHHICLCIPIYVHLSH